MSMWTCLFLIVILKETLVFMCLSIHFDIIETWKVNVGYRDIYYSKILNISYEWSLEFFVKKWNMYEAYIFQRPLQQTCSLETTPLCLNTRLRVKKNFKIHINFIEINVNVCLLCAPHVMTSIILHTRRPNCQ